MGGVRTPKIGDYDDGLGIDVDDAMINYIRESHEIQSRVSSTKCYLLQRVSSGSVQGSASYPLPITSFYYFAPNWRAVLWSGTGDRPDTRPYTSSGSGSVTVLVNSVAQTRVLEIGDLVSDSEYSLVERFDQASPAPVEVVFNAGFNPSGSVVSAYYTSLSTTVSNVRMARGEDATQSFFGWRQYVNNCKDAYRNYHQILVRMPMTTRDLSVNEEGRVTLEENDSWMIWTPYVNDFDVLVVPADYTVTGREERYEIVDKRDSIIQGSLMSQKFKLRMLELSDTRYHVAVVTTVV